MNKDSRRLGPLEACCGVPMLGVTATALMAIIQEMIKAQSEVMRLD